MRIVIIGSNGQLGSDLHQVLKDEHQIIGLTHENIEISSFESVNSVLNKLEPDIVINTAAFHNLPLCEENPAKSFEVNAVGSMNIARACSDFGAILIHYSTDYVFNGLKKTPYTENDTPDPLNVYGISKFAGENMIRTYSSRFFIIRVSGIYGKVPCRAKGGNFIYNIIKASKEKPEIRVVSDEILTPTPTLAIALNTKSLMTNENYGIYHMSCEGECSWYEFTKVIFNTLNIKTPLFQCSANDFPSSIRRPLYSVLENSNLNKIELNHMPDWRIALNDFLIRNF